MCLKRSTVNVVLHGRPVRLDPCLTAEVKWINNIGYRTVSSCCGHGRYPKTILYVTSGGLIYDWVSHVKIPRTRRFYRTDLNGFYFVPEALRQHTKLTDLARSVSVS